MKFQLLKKIRRKDSGKPGGGSVSSSVSGFVSELGTELGNAPSASYEYSNHDAYSNVDVLYNELIQTAEAIVQTEPLLTALLKRTILHPDNDSLESLIARTMSAKLIQSCGPDPIMCKDSLTNMFIECLQSDELEYGYTMLDAVKMDILACVKRDPACENPVEVLLYYKGFASLVCHRAARRKWNKKVSWSADDYDEGEEPPLSRYVSLWLQSQASAAFGLDIHPGAEIGAGIM